LLLSESSRKFINFEWVTCDLVLLLTKLIDENAYLHVYIISKWHTYNFEQFFSVLENFCEVKMIRNWSCRKYHGLKKAHQILFSILNLLLSQELLFICYLAFYYLSLSDIGFINAKMQTFSLAKSQKRFSNESCNNFIFIVHFIKLPLSAAHSICSFKYDDWWISAFSKCEMKSFNFILNVCFKMITGIS